MKITIKDIELCLNVLNLEKGRYFITPIDKGIESKNYLISINSKNNFKYILKIYPNDKEIGYEVEILNKLSCNNRQIFSPVVQKDVFFIKDKPAILLKYVKGDTLIKKQVSLSVIKKIATKQAKMHLSLLNFKPKNQKERFFIFDFSFLSYFCKNTKNTNFKRIQTEINTLKKESKLYIKINFKKSIIHEDLTQENILITNNNINFIDFGESHYAEIISDIGIAIKEIIIKNKGINLDPIQNYLNSYQKYIRLDKKEINALFFIIKRRTLFMSAYYLGRYETDKDVNFKNKMMKEFKIFNILQKKEHVIKNFINKYNKNE